MNMKTDFFLLFSLSLFTRTLLYRYQAVWIYVHMIDLKFQFTPLPIWTEREKNVKQMDQCREEEEEDYNGSLY